MRAYREDLQSASRGVSRFICVRRECSLAGTIFSSLFFVVQSDTGMLPRAQKPAIPVEFLSLPSLLCKANRETAFFTADGCFSISHVEVNLIESGGQHFFS